MGGQFSLGSKESPRYQAMEACETLAAPDGFVWSMRTRGGMPVSGSDSGIWTRFRTFWLIPIARLGDDPDHARSAFGRYVAEAVFWAPAALLPGPGLSWEAVDENTGAEVNASSRSRSADDQFLRRHQLERSQPNDFGASSEDEEVFQAFFVRNPQFVRQVFGLGS